MPLPKNINTYADVAIILEPARKEGGAEYTLDSHKEAVRWRQRAYYYRTLLYERDGFTPYDNMKLTIANAVVTITFIQVVGSLKTLDGKKLKPGEYILEDLDSDLMAAAEELAKQLEQK